MIVNRKLNEFTQPEGDEDNAYGSAEDPNKISLRFDQLQVEAGLKYEKSKAILHKKNAR